MGHNARAIVGILATLLFVALPLLARAQSSTALDTLCTNTFDYSCKFGQTDKEGKPCGQGMTVANAQVQGECVTGDKALETSYKNQDGQWVSSPQTSEQPTSPSGNTEQTTAQTGPTPSSQEQQTIFETAPGPGPVVSSESQSGINPDGNAATQNSLSPGNSVLQDAFGDLPGNGNSSAAPQNSSDNSQAPAGPAWSAGAQANLQPVNIAQPEGNSSNAPYVGAPANDTLYNSNGTISSLSQPMGNLPGLNAQQIQSANAGANETPSQQFESDVTGWIQSTFYPSDQQNLSDNGLASQDTTDMRATIYTPGAGGIDGGFYGSHDNYLDPNTPTVAAGFNSGLNYGDVVNIGNPATGQSVNAVVGDVCPACGSGIDLTPVTANAVGLSMQQGVGTMDVGLVASTGNYSAGAQLAASLNAPSDPWAGASASAASIASPGIPGVMSVNDYAEYALATNQYAGEPSVQPEEIANAEPLPASPAGEVASSPLPPIEQPVVASAESLPTSESSGNVALSGTQSAESPAVQQEGSAPEQLIPAPEPAESPPVSEVSNTTPQPSQNVAESQPQSAEGTLDQLTPEPAPLPPAPSETGPVSELSNPESQSQVAESGPEQPQSQSAPEQLQYQNPTLAQLPQWANTVVSSLQSAETSVGNDFQALANQYAVVTDFENPSAGATDIGTSPGFGGGSPTQEATDNTSYPQGSYGGGNTETTATQNSQSGEEIPLPQERPSLPSNPSIVDYLNSTGQDSSYSTRAGLAVATNVVENPAQYTGSAAQNTSLLGACWSGICGSGAPLNDLAWAGPPAPTTDFENPSGPNPEADFENPSGVSDLSPQNRVDEAFSALEAEPAAQTPQTIVAQEFTALEPAPQDVVNADFGALPASQNLELTNYENPSGPQSEEPASNPSEQANFENPSGPEQDTSGSNPDVCDQSSPSYNATSCAQQKAMSNPAAEANPGTDNSPCDPASGSYSGSQCAAQQARQAAQQKAQTLQAQVYALNSAFNRFMNNPTDANLQSLVSRAATVSSQGAGFAQSVGDANLQTLSAQLGGLTKAAGYNAQFVQSSMTGFSSQISGGIQAAITALGRYR